LKQAGKLEATTTHKQASKQTSNERTHPGTKKTAN
jgi:hypothetical protein